MIIRQNQAPKRINSFRVELVPLRPTPKYKIRSPVDVVDVVKEMEDYDREYAKIIHLDIKNQLIGIETISIGSLTAAIVHQREAVTGALLDKSYSVILVHNHPSGICTPSKEDFELHKKLTDAFKLLGIPLLDSIIVGKGCYYSFAEHGFVSVSDVEQSSLAAEPQSNSKPKQHLIVRIQSARTPQELLPIQSEISFGDLNTEERRQLHDLYQKKLASLKEEIPFGVPIRIELEKPRVLGAPLRKEIGVKRERVGIGQVPLTGGVSTSTRLGRFEPGVIEKERSEIEARKRIEKAGLPYSIHPLIKRLAESHDIILKLGTPRGKETVEDIVISRYANYCPPGTIINRKNVPKATERWIIYPQKLKSCMGELERRLAEAMTIREHRAMYSRM